MGSFSALGYSGESKRNQPSVDLLRNFAEQKKVTPADVDALESASANIKLEGARYPEFHEKLVGR